MSENLRIDLVQETPNLPFAPGSIIAGNVLLDLAEGNYKQIVLIKFTGRSYVHYGDVAVTDAETMSASTQQYVNEKQVLWNTQRCHHKLVSGHHKFPFCFKLPLSIPSSFEGSYGNIRYKLTAEASIGPLINGRAEVQVPVLAQRSVSSPHLLQPVRQEIQKTFFSSSCASRSIALTASLPKTGFCIGESFQLHSSLENGSSHRVQGVTASLVQSITYYRANGKQYSSLTHLVSVTSQPVGPQATQNWEPVIKIPTKGATILTSCRNIAVNHFLEITCQISHVHNFSTKFPIELGTCFEEVQAVISPLQQGPPHSAVAPFLQSTSPTTS